MCAEEITPVIGEIRTGRQLGKTATTTRFKYVLCVDCKKGIWTAVSRISTRCRPCHIKLVKRWFGKIGGKENGEYTRQS